MKSADGDGRATNLRPSEGPEKIQDGQKMMLNIVEGEDTDSKYQYVEVKDKVDDRLGRSKTICVCRAAKLRR